MPELPEGLFLVTTAPLPSIDWSLMGSAVLGAIVGGLLTYWLTGRLERLKRSDEAGRLQAALLGEVIGHQSIFWGDLDRALPLWIRRGDERLWDRTAPRKPIAFGHLSLDLYETFSDALLKSDLAAPIARYYRDVRSLNEHSALLKARQDANFDDQIRFAAKVFEENLKLTDALIKGTATKL